MRRIITSIFMLAALAGTLTLAAYAADAPAGTKPANLSRPQDLYQQQMMGLMTELKSAKTSEQRKEIQGRIDQARQAYRAAHPVKEPTAAEKAANQQKLEEMLKKDPYRWQLYQLQQSMRSAKTPQERQTCQAQLRNLQAKHAAEAEAKLTPAQRAAAQARKEKNAQMQAEMKPLKYQMRTAKTPEEKKAVRAQMQELFKKYL